MLIFPAIDLYEGKAVRLFQGDYGQMTVYSADPAAVGEEFVRCGADHIHLVDLEGAREGTTPNLDTVCAIRQRTGAFCEIGGGIRSMETVERYLEAGLDRVILGTAAVRDPAFLDAALARYGNRIAVGVDMRNGEVAVSGWTEGTGLDAFAFCADLQRRGVTTLICTDISRDGAMRGANRDMYRRLSAELALDIVASGGVSSLEDVAALRELGLYAAIVGKAYYTGALDLRAAVEAAR
jgi:phosphoribosylformimino-5-aminoimidazole carboxamide ribotide isomerase